MLTGKPRLLGAFLYSDIHDVKFSVIIYAAPYSSQAATSAYHFTRSVLAQGHEIYRLFFFNDGVYNANRLAVPAQDEFNVQQAWDNLIDEHQLDSVVCVSSALRRGIVDASESGRYALNAVSLSDKSSLSGLGQLVDAGVHSDRVINFG